MARLKVDLSEFYVDLSDLMDSLPTERMSDPLELVIMTERVICACSSTFSTPTGQFAVKLSRELLKGRRYLHDAFIYLPTQHPELYRHLPTSELFAERKVLACSNCTHAFLSQREILPRSSAEDFAAAWKRMHECSNRKESNMKLEMILAREEFKLKAALTAPIIPENLPPNPTAEESDND